MADYYSCLSGDQRVQIKSLLINGAILPAATICISGNAKLIQDATVTSQTVEITDSDSDNVSAAVWLETDDGEIFTTSPVAIGGSPTEPSAILQLRSNTKGLLVPVLTTAQRDAISSPAEGLLIYNSTTSSFNYYDSADWSEIGTGVGGSSDWTLMYTESLDAHATQLQVTGLDGDTEQEYKIVYHLIVRQPNVSDSMIYGFTINEVTDSNSYSSAFSVVESTGVDTAFNEMHTQIKLDENDTTGAFLAGEIHITHADSSVYRHMLVSGTTVDSDGSIIKSIQGSATWRNNSDNLISIEFNSDVANSIASGSVVEVWIKNT